MAECGQCLIVKTLPARLIVYNREYDVAVDTEEPQQVLCFVPEPKTKSKKSYMAQDDSEREVASFTIGKGTADWGPLTVYTLMRSGDIYAICPFMPKNACVCFHTSILLV